MFKPYDDESQIPAEFKGHYSKRADGKWHADIPDDHPAVSHSATLLREKQAAETAKAAAERERDEAKTALANANVLQPGQRAVPKADAELLERVKAEGVTTVEAFTTLKTRHDELTKTEGVRARQDLMRELAKAEGYDPEKAALLLADNPDVPEQFEFRDAQGGKRAAFAKVKGAGDALEVKPWADVVKGSAKLTALVPSLAGSQGVTRVPGSTGGSGTPADDKPLSDVTMEGWGPKRAAA